MKLNNILFCCLFLPSLAWAQQSEQLAPLESNPTLEHLRSRDAVQLRGIVCPVQTLSLPFFDDFSYESTYPSCSKWQDNQVYVNNHLAVRPPSKGVATFDGLRPDGKPWQAGVTTSGNPADTLTSQQINLAGQSTVYLYFQYQSCGLANRPEVEDSLVVELKDLNGNWNRVFTMKSLQGGLYIPDTVFYPRTITINQSQYLHNAFQFRFRSYASTNGFHDHWHVDYVYVNNTPLDLDPNTSRAIFQDVALIDEPLGPLRNYTTMPFKQLKGFAQASFDDRVKYQMYNHTATTRIPQLAFDIRELRSASNLLPSSNVLTPAIPAGSYLVAEPSTSSIFQASFNYAAVDASSDSVAVLRTTYSINEPGQVDPVYFGNDTVTRTTVLDDYYAYDDGTAEVVYYVQQQAEVAVGFTTNIADTLRGVHMALPFFRGYLGNNAYINMKVWMTDVNNLVLIDELIKPANYDYNDYLDTLNSFWTYAFSEPIFVPAGARFYVGWQSINFTDPVYVGFDKNSTLGSANTMVKINNQWAPTTFSGSLMIRPILGDAPVYITATEPTAAVNDDLKVYPNPTSGVLRVEHQSINAMTYELYDLNGRPMQTGTVEDKVVDMRDLPAGVYMLQCRDAQTRAALTAKRVVLIPR